MQLLVDGSVVGSTEVKTTSYAGFGFALPAAVNRGVRVNHVFAYEGIFCLEFRSLHVRSLTVNGAMLLPTDPGVTVDIGSGAAAFDGNIGIAHVSNPVTSSALILSAPNKNTPNLTVRANASLAGGVGPTMQLLVDGSAVGST